MAKAQVISLKNVLSSQRRSSVLNRIGNMLGMSKGGKRDSYQIYGYPESLDGHQGYDRMYAHSKRNGYANKLTSGHARACWRSGFLVQKDPEDEDTVDLEDQLKILKKTGLNQAIERADILNRIGRMAVLLVGVPDGLDLDQPVGRAVSGENGLELTYFRPYAYPGINIVKFVEDDTDPRFGLPEIYELQTTGGDSGEAAGRQMVSRVHYSRVVHMNEQGLESDTHGMGYLEPVFNRILDLDKATGGAAEAYFRNARGKIGYEIDKEFAASILNDESQRDEFNAGAEKFTNEWQEHTIATGAKIKTLDTPQQSPADTVKAALWELSGYSGYPLRVLTGEGAGQLAGSEDQLAVNQLIADRQSTVLAPWVMETLLILEASGLLTIDPESTVVFPKQSAATEADEAEISYRKSQTFAQVAQGMTQPGADGVGIESVLEAVGLSEIEVNTDVNEDRLVQEALAREAAIAAAGNPPAEDEPELEAEVEPE